MSLIFSARVGGFFLALAALGIPLAPGASSAKVCGGDVACECGDRVQGVAVLQSDLGVCPGLGLAMSTGSVLDCAGHTITGTDPLPGEWYGVELDTVSGAQVRNCRVTAFRRGLRVIGGGGHTLVGNKLFKNKYGIDLAGQTAANRIEGNVIQDSRDEGIHVGTGARDNLIVGNQILGSKLENVYLLEASGTRLIGNVVVDAGNAAIFIKDSVNNYVADNIVWDTPIQLRGDSWGNVLENNDLRGDGYVFEAFQEAVWKYPHGNQVSGGTVFNAGTCVQMLGAYGNVIQGVRIDDDCGAVEEVPTGGLQPFGNSFDLTVTEPGPAGSRSAVQVSTSARELHAGDVLTVGLAVHNGPTNVPLDLYVGVLLPDNQIAFFSSPGVIGGLTTVPSGLRPMQAAPPSFSLTLPRFVEVALPVGTPPGTYYFFAALLGPSALADGVITASEVAALDLEWFTVQP